MRKTVLLLSISYSVMVFLCSGCNSSSPSGQTPVQEFIANLINKSSITRGEKLMSRLGSDDPDLRREGVYMLADKDVKHYATVEKVLFIMAQGDADAHVRAAALHKMADISKNRQQVLDLLETASYDRDVIVREECVNILDSGSYEECMDILIRLLSKDDNVTVRSKAAWALRHYRKRDAIRALIAAIYDEDFVAYRARKALVELVGEDFGDDQQAWRKWLFSSGDQLQQQVEEN